MATTATPSVSSEIVNRMSMLWVRKMQTFFRMYDINGTGVFSKQDADKLWEERARSLLNDGQRAVLDSTCQNIWTFMFKSASMTVKERTIVNWTDFLESRFQGVYYNREKDEADFRELLRTFFSLIDHSGRGGVTSEEFMRCEYLFGINRYEAAIAFATVDRDCSGTIRFEEYMENWVRFYYSTDWDNHTMAFGRLISTPIAVIDDFSIKWIITVPRAVLHEMGDLWIRKMLTFFRTFDEEGRGVLTMEDIAQILRSRVRHKLSKERLDMLAALVQKLWKTLWAPASKTSKNDRTVVEWGDFLHTRYVACRNFQSREEKEMKDLQEAIYKLGDVTGSGSIQLEDYLPLTFLHGMTRHQASVSFTSMDVGMEGKISLGQALKAWRNFFYSTVWDSGTLAYGCLDNAKILPTD